MRLAVLVALSAAGALLLSVSGANAVHDAGCPLSGSPPATSDVGCLFELHANDHHDTASGANNGGFDWAAGPGGPGVFDANGNQTLVDPQLLRSEFVADYTRPDTSYFATSAKDIDDVSTWQCGSVNNPTAKDEILNAYAALWRPTSGADAGHIILTAAAERLSNNGNAFMGFWLFQGRVACNSATGTATPFVGAHNVGDVLILSNFTGGGNNPLVQVYVWNPSTAQATNPLELKFTGNFCSASDPLDQACGEVNTTSFQTPWAPSTTALTALDNNDFLEVGVDLTQLLTNANTTVPCFARFQAETRTSQETTAQLKDFASGSLNTCTATTVTHPKDANGATLSDSTPVPSSTVIHDEATVTGTALVGTAPNPKGTVAFSYCRTTDQTAGGSTACDASGSTSAGTATLDGTSNPATVSSSTVTGLSAGRYCFTAIYLDTGTPPDYALPASDDSTTECFLIAKASPTVTTQASANIVLGAGSLTDTATLAGGVSPTGSITFNLYGPNDATCAGTVVFTSTVSVSGNGNYTSAAFTPTAAGTYRWIANYSGDANNNATANGCNAANENVTVIHPSINIEKTPDSQSFQTGGTATFTITVTNTGDVTLTGVHITDAQAPGCARTAADLGAANATLDPGETFNYSCTKANVTADFTNSATATGTPPIGPDVTDTDTADVDVIAPAINIEKTPDSQSFQTGGTATFTITVTNTGDVTLTGVHITDAQAPGCARSAADLGADATLAPGASFNYQCTLANVTADFTNSATATGTPPTGPDVTDTDTAVVDVIHPSINIEKTPDSQRFLTHGTATFTITVTNTGDVTLTGVHVTDAEAAGCARTAAELGANATLVAGASFSYDCTRANVTADFTNSATVTGTPPVGPDVTDTDTADVDVIAPEITIEKTPDTQSLLTGSTATFTITVTNTGDVTLTDVHVTDAQAPGCARSAADLGAANATLDPGESFNYTCTLANVTADFTNSATVTGTPPLGQDVSSTDTAEVTVHQAPGINVEKTPDSQTILSGGTAAFTITVTNTGDVTLTGVHVTDAQAPGCARTAADLGANATLAPSASFNYQCTLANVTADFTNSATATGTPPAGPDVSDTDTAVVDVIHPAINVEKTPDSQSFQTGGTATFTITVTNTGDVALTGVHVTDAQAPGCARTAADLGANATLAPSASFNYQCTLANVTAGFTNSATVTGTPPVGPDVSDTDTADVTVTQAPPPPPPPPVPDARISINPPTAQNPVNTNHVLTAHVDVQTNTGQPFANAPDGTQITVSIASGPGSFTTANPCTTAGGTGSCTVTLTSAVAGTSVVNATATVTVSGVPLTRTTNGQAGNSGPAEKTWNILTPPPACESLSATPRQLKVGKAFTIVATAMLDNGKPMAGARVALTAPGKVAMTKRTNAQGVAKFNLKLQKKGILRLRVLGSPQCTARRGIAPPDEITG